MASMAFAKPGTKYGPCETDCQHKDCAQVREEVAKPCQLCTKPIGYDTQHYSGSQPGTLAHAICIEDFYDEQKRLECARNPAAHEGFTADF